MSASARNDSKQVRFNDVKPVCRFAPSPTGRMHAGNVFAALVSWLVAKSQGGSVVLRIEDLDAQRSKQDYADQIMRDFESLGLTWDKGPYYQHGREEAYESAYKALATSNGIYPCFCTRADLHAASAPHRGEKLVYPGTCRRLTQAEVSSRMEERSPAYRIAVPDRCYSLNDLVQGDYSQNLVEDCGDFVIRRSDGAYAYQLAVVVDDAEQGVNCVVRGMDLLCSTPQQMFLADTLGYAPCTYAHVPLLVAERNRRLSKRDHDASLEQLLVTYGSARAVIGHIAGLTGLASTSEPVSCEELLEQFSVDQLATCFPDLVQIEWH